ncbi:thioesterase domain-containing protein [Paenibacillus sp. ClWae2A]|uniref:thioesterase II family protein n=1 Tax=Paenibacillus sp. ClWae2A TaxID=3057177 RepID=UPI0028F56E70|nr:thioesterase domain-containing protein [Paenibacillus sp. ClWae2A]MDT9721665.1 thioesterase domain-containing protein [Paenibacillus sp. ClWae2A]
MENLNLFCFPCAGGMSSMYSDWKSHLLPHISIVSMELAGRGYRTNESLYSSFDELINDMFERIQPYLENQGEPYALFGHSMGASIIFELTHKLIQEGYKPPVHLFISSRRPPHHTRDALLHTLPDDQFLNALQKLGGISEILVSDESFLSYFLPILKSDITNLESNNGGEEKPLLGCNITVLMGEDESILSEEIREWERYTQGETSLHTFPGGHFYLNSQKQNLIAMINNTLMNVYTGEYV